jgi:hypothetical protein
MIADAKTIDDMTAAGAKIQAMGLNPEAVNKLRATATQRLKEIKKG